MIDRSKKYKKPGDLVPPHTGNLLKAHKQQYKLSVSGLARELGVSRTSASSYFEHESLQLGILWKISLVLEHNFFTAFADALPFGPESVITTALKQQLEEKDQVIAKLQAELEVYKRIVSK